MGRTLAIVFLFPVLCACAQSIAIKTIELTSEGVVFYYTLKDSLAGRAFAVNLFTSRDNYTMPLRNLTGDFGVDILPGDKRGVWNAREEFGSGFRQSLTFEIRARVYTPLIIMNRGLNNKKIKQGSAYEISWSGGRPESILDFELYREETRVLSYRNVANRGHYTLVLPINVKAGAGYHLRIADARDPSDAVITDDFRIKRKIPLAYKVAPLVLLGMAEFLASDKHADAPRTIAPFPSPPK